MQLWTLLVYLLFELSSHHMYLRKAGRADLFPEKTAHVHERYLARLISG